jgi:tRNA pseudouridine38-40 synthase
MPRYKLTIEYDGSPFLGWQVQDGGLTVAGVLEDAVEKLSGMRTKVSGAGRTDAGVHARGQVAHIDLGKDWDADVVRDGLNAHLRPHPVAILYTEKVSEDFDARFSATRRHYLYRILNRRSDLALDRNRFWRVARPLDEKKMQEAARHLVGHHDFTTFRSTECQAKSPIKTLDVLNVTRDGQEVLIETSARSFLHNQVRSIAGSLEQVGEGKWTPADMKRALEARDRSACGPVAPPGGLYLMRVDYEK